jgi:hypothetical protein
MVVMRLRARAPRKCSHLCALKALLVPLMARVFTTLMAIAAAIAKATAQ